MAKHEFGMIDQLSYHESIYENFEPVKYHCISIDDNFIEPLLLELEELDTYFHNMKRPEKGLAYCGVTLISPASLKKFREILISKNDCVYTELLEIIDRAIVEKKYVIHYGI